MSSGPTPTTSTAAPGKGMLLVISGPSGVGKTTITHSVEKAFPGAVFSVSATTRPRAAGEIDGEDYHYVSDARFDELVVQGAFLEWANVFGKRYGTLRQWVLDRLAEGRLVILEIDVQGAINVKGQLTDPRNGRPGCCAALFVLPPGEDALLQRLRARRREGEEAIQKRFAEAKREIAAAQASGVYDGFVVNETLDRAINESIQWVRERLC
ncbi:MAG: guanylate kinase [Phycisphaerales bacterium]|nr:guanylate kinase [Phycisphaerales bacterium]